jgi:hypothetical protein
LTDSLTAALSMIPGITKITSQTPRLKILPCRFYYFPFSIYIPATRREVLLFYSEVGTSAKLAVSHKTMNTNANVRT